MNHQILSGLKIARQIDEDQTVDTLSRNVDNFQPASKKRQHATQTVQIAQLKYIPAIPNNTLKFTAVARNFESGKKYDPTVSFGDVEYEQEDTQQNITFTAVDSEKYHIKPINLRQSTARVSCNCLDFYFRFATWNFNTDSLEGPRPRTYVRKTNNRPPVNPGHVPGLCKHLIKLIEVLRRTGVVKF